MKNMKKKNMNKKLLLLLLVMAVAMASIGATIAWMTAESELDNKFTVGSFNPPTTDPTDPTNPIDPTNPEEDDKDKLNGNLYEPKWVPDSKIVPGATIPKDPYVGIGKDSEDAYVYVYVDNNFTNKNGTIGFYINEGWEAVEGYVQYNSAYNEENKNFYTKGLFKYTNGLTGASEKEVWTSKPLFDNIVVQNDATVDDLTPIDDQDANTEDARITVKSYIHQMYNGKGTDAEHKITETEVQGSAIEAFGATSIDPADMKPATKTP